MTTTTTMITSSSSRNFVGNKVPRVCRKTRRHRLGENRMMMMMMMKKKISTRDDEKRRNERSRFGCVRVAAAASRSSSGSSNDDNSSNINGATTTRDELLEEIEKLKAENAKLKMLQMQLEDVSLPSPYQLSARYQRVACDANSCRTASS